MAKVEDPHPGGSSKVIRKTATRHTGSPRRKTPAWRPCSESFTTVLTFRAPHPDKSQQTSNGGSPSSPNQPSEGASRRRTRFMISLLSRTPAQVRASQSSSARDGGHGDLLRDGTQIRETSGGPKQWGSNSSRAPSRITPKLVERSTLKSTEITKGSSRGGRGVAAETLASTRFSNVLQSSLETRALSSTQDMSEAPKTRRTTRLAADTHWSPFSSLPSTSPMSSENSSSTTTILRMIVNSRMTSLTRRYIPYKQNKTQWDGLNTGERTMTSTPQRDTYTRPRPRSNGTNFGRDQFEKRSAPGRTTNSDTPGRYPPGLIPVSSLLRPACPAKDRLLLWKPAASANQASSAGPLLPTDEEHIREVLAEAYSDSTKATYGTGLLVFHVFCDKKGIDEPRRTPCGQTLLSSFISTLIGDYSAQAIENYTYGLRAWHAIHRIAWDMNNIELKTLLIGREKLTTKVRESAETPHARSRTWLSSANT